ncbi:MAG: hypothetical protein NUV53_00040, partial [Patescibacteria group bacterium]|nr:hypothetical protein [Patescibacteria group bacterium]
VQACQNCKTQFTIEPEDFDFYKKIDVPPPTFCPECRYQRRLMVRNERNFYKRECDLCKNSIVSMYSAEKPFPVYCSECWWGDGWDPMQYGAEYDFSKPFFVQIRELQEKVPRPHLRCTNLKNSNFCNYVADGKECYLCFGSIEVENCLYGSPYGSKYCIDTYLARESEFCYECTDCENLSHCIFCQDCSSSINLSYCFDCKNCQDCIGCVGLRNKNYCVFNEQLSKEDYEKEKSRLLGNGRTMHNEVRKKHEKLKNRIPHRFATTLQCVGVSGDHIVQSKNARQCFDVKRTEDCAYCVRMIDAKDTYDTNYCEYLELCYDYLGFWKMARSRFSNTCGEGSDIEYSDFCSGSSFLFGCVGVRKKDYCILNKRYPKDEYEKIKAKIIVHMNEMPYEGKNGRVYRYGEFFPAEISLLAYNESVAQDFFPLSREEVVSKGFIWKEPEERHYSVTITPDAVPEHIEDIPDSIVDEVVGCAHEGGCNHQCTTAFKIITPELQYYRRMNLPLPQLCPNCRHYERLAQRNPLRVWRRQCDCVGVASINGVYHNTISHSHGDKRCPNKFETPYDSNRPEIVYCAQCYNNEIV